MLDAYEYAYQESGDLHKWEQLVVVMVVFEVLSVVLNYVWFCVGVFGGFSFLVI